MAFLGLLKLYYTPLAVTLKGDPLIEPLEYPLKGYPLRGPLFVEPYLPLLKEPLKDSFKEAFKGGSFRRG